MTKLGDQYQEVVAIVERTLDPGAEVRVGVWVMGPDGRRDLDVEVRGMLNGKPSVTQIECKDWNTPVGIAVIDALDSKRKDLGADNAVVYSNSGFTKDALRKAARVGIGLASALKSGDSRVRVVVEREVYAKELSVDTFTGSVYPRPGLALQLPAEWTLSGLMLNGLPVQNWIAERSRVLLQADEPNGWHRLTLCFQPDCDWSYDGVPVSVGAIRVAMNCRCSWKAQAVRVDATLGLYDHIRKVVTIPDRQGYLLGWIDQTAWKSIDSPTFDPYSELPPGTFSLELTALNAIPKVDPPEVPDVQSIILEEEWIACEAP